MCGWMDVYVITWLRGIEQRSECLQERVTIDSQDYILNNHIFHTVVIK